jgi:uncharacterized membrane protein YgdD (TMEM256/DUF423 family)
MFGFVRRLMVLPLIAFGAFAQYGFAHSFEPGTSFAWKLGYAVAASLAFLAAGRLSARKAARAPAGGAAPVEG